MNRFTDINLWWSRMGKSLVTGTFTKLLLFYKGAIDFCEWCSVWNHKRFWTKIRVLSKIYPKTKNGQNLNIFIFLQRLLLSLKWLINLKNRKLFQLPFVFNFYQLIIKVQLHRTCLDILLSLKVLLDINKINNRNYVHTSPLLLWI